MVIQRTCAVTASVSSVLRVRVGGRHRRSFLAQQIRGSGSPTSWSITRLPPKLVSTSTIPGGSVRTSPISAARSQPAPSAARRAPRRRPRARRRRRACPRSRRTSGRSPGSRTRRPRRGRPAPRPRARASPRCDARASSFSTEATPPRVASRMQRSDGPASSSSASTTGHSERVSDSIVGVELELAAREHDRRAVLADRAGEQDAVAGADRVRGQAARAGRARRCRWCRRTCRRRRRARRPWCRRPRSPTPAASAAAAIASTSARSSSAARPSSRISDRRQRERARARHGQVVDGAVHRQLADRAAGEAQRLDDEGVGRQRQRDAVDLDAPRRPRCTWAPKAGANRPSIMLWVALPPAPWAMFTRSSRNLPRLRARGLDDPEDALLAVADGAALPHHTTSRSRAKRP